jgi:phosphatidylserine/phosphatidylglycerophosphate/cardiolipin synthase-like enzyme
VNPTDWFLTSAERGNPHTDIAAWCDGNLVEPLVHGATYFDVLAAAVEACGPGNYVFFTDWRGDPDERLRDGGPTTAELFSAAAERGVIVKGLMWRSHLDRLQYSEEENRHLGEDVERAGGIDLCHSRRDDEHHLGDPQAVQMSPRYGDRPPWHDVQLRLRGPIVDAVDAAFRESWCDPASLDMLSPFAWVRDKLTGADLTPDALPERPPVPRLCGPHAVQTLRTYPDAHFAYSFAPRGERSIARGYTKVIKRVRRLIYLEDQYLWSKQVADLFAAALRGNPDLHLVAVVPRHPDVDGRFALPPNQIGRHQAIEACRRASPHRVHVFDIENHLGTPVYVHAKVCVVDDVWGCVGSDNFNRRSWSHDSELSCAVLDETRDGRSPRDPAGRGDGARVFARDLRLRLLREHLDRAADGSEDDGLVDPTTAVAVLEATARALDEWHEGGRVGPRPPGRLRAHRPERLGVLTRLWAGPVYRMIYDPDGRSYRDRIKGVW